VIVGWRGTAVELDAPDEVADQVLAQLPPFYTQVGEPVATVAITRDGGMLHLEAGDGLDLSGPDGPEMHRACASRLELVLVDKLPDLVAVHAGVVADGTGVLVFPGRSMVGKSTLTRALLEAGATYWSDEFALLDGDGLVHPYPRAMTIRTPHGSERHVPELHGTEPQRARLVAMLQYDEKGWDVRDLTPGETTMGLIDNCVSVRRDPARALTALTALAETAKGIGGTRGDATDTAAHLLT
jgi:hypothetical protein